MLRLTPVNRSATPDMGSRRAFMRAAGAGATAVAIGTSLPADAQTRKPVLDPQVPTTLPREPHHQPQADSIISLWMQGGPSHLDLFDPKPVMQKLDGQPFPGEIKYDNAAQASSKVLHSPWKFRKHGESGIEMSELVPSISQIADDITLIRSMKTGVNNHGQSIRALNSGTVLGGRPSLGSWLTYALGCSTRDLPAFVALIDPGQLPVMGVENWSNGWLPSLFQGTVVRPTEPRILDLQPQANLAGTRQKSALSFLKKLNTRHLKRHPGTDDLAARISTYDLAARMQTAATEALDIAAETQATQRMYGLEREETREYGTRCLIARRLIERGVRCVQVFTRNQYWDHHNGIFKSLPAACAKVDQPSAALVTDLKQRGLLERTVVHWGGEMGRLPVIQNDGSQSKIGRDHNTHGFSMWVAGGGFRAGYAHGATDDFGHHAVESPVNHFDYHATLLNLFGFDHTRLSFERSGQDLTLTNGQPAKVIDELLS